MDVGSGAAPPPFALDLSWGTSWPLYVVYPGSLIFFTALYFLGPHFWPRLAPYYKNMSPLNKACWRQNWNAMLHSTSVTIVLFVAILSDDVMRNERPLHPHHNLAAYIGVAISAGYFTFTIPWSYRLYFCKGERHATNFALCFHHAIVYLAAITYLIGRTCSLYGSIAFSAMEFTNWFFIPHILQQQARSTRTKLWNANYVVLCVSFVGMRLVLCTWMLVLFSQDLSRFRSDDAGEWALVGMQYAIFAMATLLSWVWLWQGIQDLGLLPMLKRKLGGKVGPDKRTATSKRRLPAGGVKVKTPVKPAAKSAAVDSAPPYRMPEGGAGSQV